MNPWIDGNDLLEQIDDWYDEDNRHVTEWRWRDTEQTVHLHSHTNEIVGFGTVNK